MNVGGGNRINYHKRRVSNQTAAATDLEINKDHKNTKVFISDLLNLNNHRYNKNKQDSQNLSVSN